jgi:diguanylate cyclase (GGDEF)-like protein
LTVFSGVAYLCILAFTRAFLATREHPRLDIAVKLLMVASLAVTFAPLFVTMNVSYQMLMAMLYVFPLASGVIGFVSWWGGRREARFFVLGQAASWIGLLTVGLMIHGVVPYGTIVGEGISIGIAADALLLAFALADRIRLLQDAKLTAENAARKNLELRREELERIVSERTSDLEIARKQAETLATIDPLTSILNRRGLLPPAEREVSIARRHGRSLAVVMFDLDHFKRVNDRCGHAEGDRVLRDVAAAAKACIRQTDLLGRIGGEEFLIVLPDASRDIARQTAERIRGYIEANVAPGVPREPVTASFGVAWLNDDVTSIDALESSADHALYRAKHRGRNRVELADTRA